MKRLVNILLVLSLVSLFSCKKIVEPISGGLVIDNVSVDVITHANYARAQITATYYYPGEELCDPRIYVSRYSDMEYGANYQLSYNEGVLVGTTSSVLDLNTTYYFCFVYYDGIEDIKTGSYSFTTTK